MPANNLLTWVFALLFFSGFHPATHPTHQSDGLEIVFENNKYRFTPRQRVVAQRIIIQSSEKVRTLLPSLPSQIKVSLLITNENLNEIGGVNGVALRNNPAEVVIAISRTYPGGILTAVKKSLSVIIFHEFHHLSRGWAYHDNAFETNILNASINEGLAIVFAEKYTGISLARFNCPHEINHWIREIRALPKNANFDHWMFEHPDGRSAIGYKVGKHLVEIILRNTRKSIVEVSKYSPEEILQIADQTFLMGSSATPLYPGFLLVNPDKSSPFAENSTKSRHNPNP